jgi:hypothetical protein
MKLYYLAAGLAPRVQRVNLTVTAKNARGKPRR